MHPRIIPTGLLLLLVWAHDVTGAPKAKVTPESALAPVTKLLERGRLCEARDAYVRISNNVPGYYEEDTQRLRDLFLVEFARVSRVVADRSFAKGDKVAAGRLALAALFLNAEHGCEVILGEVPGTLLSTEDFLSKPVARPVPPKPSGGDETSEVDIAHEKSPRPFEPCGGDGFQPGHRFEDRRVYHDCFIDQNFMGVVDRRLPASVEGQKFAAIVNDLGYFVTDALPWAAAMVLQKTAEVWPDRNVAWLNLADALVAAGEDLMAVAAYECYLDKTPAPKLAPWATKERDAALGRVKIITAPAIKPSALKRMAPSSQKSYSLVATGMVNSIQHGSTSCRPIRRRSRFQIESRPSIGAATPCCSGESEDSENYRWRLPPADYLNAEPIADGHVAIVGPSYARQIMVTPNCSATVMPRSWVTSVNPYCFAVATIQAS